MNPNLTHSLRIGIVGQFNDYSQQVMYGIITYARPYRDWSFRTAWPTPQGVSDLVQWGAHGLIGQLTDPQVVAAVVQSGLPAVNISNGREVPELTCVLNDDLMIGKLAADHLFSLGCRHYAYVGQHPIPFVEQRRRGFVRGLNDLGPAASYSELLDQNWADLAASQRGRTSPIADWLEQLPKPVGLFCSDDILCYYVHGACIDSGLDLINDVRLLGVDNNIGLCEATYPPFSSVQNGEVGFRGAECLDLLMQGRPVPPISRVPPQRIVVRGGQSSTPALPMEVQAILRYIASHSGEPIQAADALNHVPLSRRAMELKFKQATGKSIYQVIQEHRVGRASMLLGATRWPLERIATASGFADPRQFSRVFRQLMNMTPRDYRKRHAATPASMPITARNDE